ncbi:cytochrome P450 [Herpetosiphon geysericola]|uniref:Cytochrome P450 n=1 Tax=Herpetosiphon geysericola TaxID=70996 RepID=A0A0P6Y5K9_9CHLR|nr:cytochrome P450 [Herpetosiphon geysericola]KPL80614.1 hypothetical protein SE18_23650 [Herpetosiphon geysericola]
MANVHKSLKQKSIPGPKPLLLGGNIGKRFAFSLDRVKSVMDLYTHFGDVAAMVANDTRRIFAFGPAFNHQILSNTDLFQVVPFLKAPPHSSLERLGQGLIMMNGDEHRYYRSLLQPAFHKNAIESYHRDIASLTVSMLDSWEKQTSVWIVEEIRSLNIAIANKILFGIAEAKNNDSLGKDFQTWLQHITRPSTILFPINAYPFPYAKMLAFSSLLEQKVVALMYQKASIQTTDVLSILLDSIKTSDEPTSMIDLVGQVATIFLASYETTTNALIWTLLLLCQHPAIMDQVVAEIQAVCGQSSIEPLHLRSLPYLGSVIKESLRLLPPAIYSHRVTTDDCFLGDYAIAQGSRVSYSPYVTHRMPELYQEPNRFDPHRWESIKPSPYEYLPFGAGSRMCIGVGLATTQLTIILAMIIQRYSWRLAPKAKVDYQVLVSLGIKGDIQLQLEKPDNTTIPQPIQGTIRRLVDFPV